MPAPEQHRFTIGREEDCDLMLADMTVSRRHAALDRGAGGWLLSDLGSTNGTRLNGWRVTTPVRVCPGDQIGLGNMSLVVAARPGMRAEGGPSVTARRGPGHPAGGPAA